MALCGGAKGSRRLEELLLGGCIGFGSVILFGNRHLTKPMQRTAQARVYVVGVLPVAVSRMGVNCADKVDFSSAGCFV